MTDGKDLAGLQVDLEKLGGRTWQAAGRLPAAAMPDLADAVEETGPAEATLSATGERGGVVRVTGRVEGAVRLNCARCMKTFDLTLSAEVERLYAAGEDPTLLEPEHEMVEEIDYIPDGLFSPARMVEEELILLIPMIPVCDEACRGLCAGCGADLNHGACSCPPEEPSGPFAALKALKK